MPSVASSAAVQPHSHAPEPRGRAHTGHEPNSFAELLDAATEDQDPPAQANGPGSKELPPQASERAKEVMAAKASKAENKEAKHAAHVARKEAHHAEKAHCRCDETECAEVEDVELADATEASSPVAAMLPVDETATDETPANEDPAAALAASPAPAMPPEPEPVMPQMTSPESVMPPTSAPPTLPAELAEAIDSAEPMEMMPIVQPFGTNTPANAPPIEAPLAASESAADEQGSFDADSADALEQADIDAEPLTANHPWAAQPSRRATPAMRATPATPATAEKPAEPATPATRAMPADPGIPEHTENLSHGRPAEAKPASPPPHAVAAGLTKQDNVPDHANRSDPGTAVGQSAEVQFSNGPNHTTAQTQAFSFANAQALNAPAAEHGTGHGIPVAAAVPIAGLAIEIAARMQAGRNRFEIRLDPPELGRVDVRLDVDREGQVTSRLVVERAETLELLRRDASQLERALQQAGLKTADNSLQFTLRDQSFAGRDGERPNAARVIVPDPELPPVETGRIYGRLLGLGGGIDIRV